MRPTNEGDMTKTVLASAVAVALWVAPQFAQEQSVPAATEKASAPAHNVFVLTGCLTTGVDPAATFKLTDASAIGRAPGGAAESDALGTSGQKASYELRPVSGVNAQGLDADTLKSHLGQRVEMIVRPLEAPAAAPSPAPAGAVRPSEPTPERFSVTEIKRVIGTCS
jgi:hypothetical protein